MHRVLIAVIFVASQSFATAAASVSCLNPFANMTSEFQLTEKLACSGLTSPAVLYVASIGGTGTSSGPFVSPGCVETLPYFDFYVGKNIVAYSDPMTDALDDFVRVSRACDGERIFLIDRDPALLTLANQEEVNTSLRVYAEDDQRTLLAYVTVAADAPSGLVLSHPDGSVAATAAKVFNSAKKACSATWTVVNDDNTEATATIMAYLLSLKDNANFDCVPANKSGCKQESHLATAGKIAVGTVIGAVIASAGFYSFLKCHNNYAKLTD